MNILVATDGALNPAQAANAVARCHRDGDSVTVFTAINMPTELLRQLGDSGIKVASQIALEAGNTLGAGDRAAERLVGSMSASTKPKVDSPIMSGLASTAANRTKPIVDALSNEGVEARRIWRTTDNRTAQTVISVVKDLEIDLLVIGSHGGGRFEGLLGSTGTKLVRHSPCDVLVLRNARAG